MRPASLAPVELDGMGALDGVMVVDFGQWIAGPLAAMLLGDQGAEVLHVDPPGGPCLASPANATLNRGKQQLVLDLKRGADLATARHLIERADVVIENWRPGVMERLGLGADRVMRGNPHLVYCSLPGFAADDPRAALPAWEGVLGAATGTYWQPGEARFTALPISSSFGALAAAVAIVMALIGRQRDGSVGFCGEGGPWERVPGYEPNAQAMTGMMARMAGKTGPPAMQPFAPNDYATGLLGAFALGLALFHRGQTGQAQRVHTSLAAAATILQAPYLQAYDGKASDEPSGPDALGWGPLQRLYRASDGWLFLGAVDADLARLDAVPGLSAIAGLRGAGLEAALAARFPASPAAEWVSRLTAAGIGAQPVISATELMQDPWVIAHGLSVTREHGSGERITTIGPPARLSRTPVIPGRPVSAPGGDAAEILAGIGLANQLDDLVTRRIVALE